MIVQPNGFQNGQTWAVHEKMYRTPPLIRPPSASEIVRFANWFCGERIKTFRKDMSICMTPDENRSHAYMPAVMGCASFIELFAGLFAGQVSDPVGILKILDFTNKFLDNSEFTQERICLLFAMFRHKVAHVSKPYSIFYSHDARPKDNPLKFLPPRRFTWKITATFNKPAIQIIPKLGHINKSRRPSWRTASYSHICQINLKRMIKELPESVSGLHGYLNNLSADPDLQENFRRCMDSFYP